MVNSLFVVSVAILGLGADDRPQNWKEVAADLNRQIGAAKKQQEALVEEKKTLEAALHDARERSKRRMIQLENEKRIAFDERDDKERKLLLEQQKSRVLAQAVQECCKRISVLQMAIDSMRSDVKVALDERSSLRKKLADITATADARKILFDRLTKAVREKRYDDAQKLAEAAEEAEHEPQK